MPSKQGFYQTVAFDGGGVTGWAHIIVDARAFMSPDATVIDHILSWNCGEYDGTMHENIDAALERVHSARYGKMPFLGNVRVIGEDFDLGQRMGSRDDLLSSYHFNVVMAYECEKQFALTYVPINRTLRINITPERLTAFGFPPRNRRKWTKTGEGKDMFAAMQHAVADLRRTKLDANQRPWQASKVDVGRFSYPSPNRNSVRS